MKTGPDQNYFYLTAGVAKVGLKGSKMALRVSDSFNKIVFFCHFTQQLFLFVKHAKLIGLIVGYFFV
jgi:hypothetical protein